jgi:alpha-amylase/alpha-mannosidase (GH57 family)
MPSERYICIHGHFYQPPRENPWLETVETQDSAAPYHDWNERITAECYATNGASRIVNEKNEIIRIINNYARISFNYGPTLLSWLEANASRAYRNILEADRRSQRRFGGHGSAVAQVYNHIIMPLASTRDRISQIRWGIADFRHRFGRKPEGMWLSETAVDSESLELLADHGIEFTILAPSQCARIRRLTAPDASAPPWTSTPNAEVDTTRPYLVRLKTGRTIGIFFYDGPRSRAIAFEGLLNSGVNFANRLNGGFKSNDDGPQLVHVATDGESYGHHHKHGEMALSYALRFIEQQNLARLTNYAEYLHKFPPTYEAEIVESTSWSCSHGVERWRSNCGCNGGHGGWNQEWRAPLREALDWLRDTIGPLTEEAGKSVFTDVWAARDAYIAVVLDRTPAVADAFLAQQATHRLSATERVRAIKLMEMQRHAMLMYTSCGWFFDEISGIETVQIIAYASRVLQLAAEVFGPEHASIEKTFVEMLERAKSNLPEEKDGASIYLRSVKQKQVGLEQVAAHYAISSVFSSYPEQAPLFCYAVRRLDYQVFTSGRGKLVAGKARIISQVTEESEAVVFAVLHFGDQNITAAVKAYTEAEEEAYAAFLAGVKACIARADFPEVIRLFDRYLGTDFYSIKSLFTDEQRRILRLILNSTLSEVESSLCTIYEDHASLLHFLSQAGLPKPPALTLAAGFAINAGLRRALESDPIDAVQVRSLLQLAAADLIVLDSRELSYMADQRMKRAMVDLHGDADNSEVLDKTVLVARTLRELPLELNLWQAQNIWYDTLKVWRREHEDTSFQDTAAWLEKFLKLGRFLYICVEELVVEEQTPGGLSSFIAASAR